MLKDRGSYGYELMERLTALGIEDTDLSTVYRALRRMEKKGMVSSGWETARGGPARRVYSITEDGEAYLESWMNSLEQQQKMIEMFFRIYTEGKNGSPRHDKGRKTDGC
jgi:poly-beta-hydroxybutyrate-responsive repressor